MGHTMATAKGWDLDSASALDLNPRRTGQQQMDKQA
jgi:hypothetical protein